MLNKLRANWRTVSTGLVVMAVLGSGAAVAKRAFAGDCCYPGAACCKPGSPCCQGHKAPAPR